MKTARYRLDIYDYTIRYYMFFGFVVTDTVTDDVVKELWTVSRLPRIHRPAEVHDYDRNDRALDAFAEVAHVSLTDSMMNHSVSFHKTSGFAPPV
jgi:hypothetical protein